MVHIRFPILEPSMRREKSILIVIDVTRSTRAHVSSEDSLLLFVTFQGNVLLSVPQDSPAWKTSDAQQ